MAKVVSISDVAKDAGVSVATVSYVINNTKQVKPETREKVESSIRHLGFRPNMIARSFKTGKKNLVAFVVPDIANNFFSTLIESIEQVLASQNVKLMILNTKETKERELDLINVVANGVVDGFIVASTVENYKELKPVLPSNLPFVFIDRQIEKCPYDSITVNCYNALCEGVEYLISKGHKKIGYITGLSRISTTKERLKAYEDTMKAHGLYNPSLVMVGDSMRHCVDEHLQNILDMGCTAIAISNNIMGAEAMIQMNRRGLIPGKDIELLGFLDGEELQYGFHNIDLVCQPTAELGIVAGKRMLERLENPDMSASTIVLQAKFEPYKG